MFEWICLGAVLTAVLLAILAIRHHPYLAQRLGESWERAMEHKDDGSAPGDSE